MDLEFYPVIIFDHNNIPQKFIVWWLNTVLRITVKPVFIAMEYGEDQFVFGKVEFKLYWFGILFG